MAEKKSDALESFEVTELDDKDLEDVAGGVQADESNCNCGCPSPTENCNCSCGAS